jgi:tetratricopeptide (TPR) repeat protein
MTVMRWVSAFALASLGLMACGKREAAGETTPAKVASNVPAQADSVAQERAAAEAAWTERDSEPKLREAIAHWEKVVELDPKDHESWTRLTRAIYFLADGHIRFHTDERAEDDMLATFEKAVTAAEHGLMALSEPFAKKMRDGAKIEEAAKELDKNGVPLLYWRASALGKWATAKGFATLLSYKDEIKNVMQICLDKDPTYFHSGPDRYFGVFYARAPGFAGGDLGKSRAHFDKSLTAEPNYLGTSVLMAEDLAVKSQDKKLFEERLDFVLKANPAMIPEIAPENRVEQKKAKELLTKKDELFE